MLVLYWVHEKNGLRVECWLHETIVRQDIEAIDQHIAAMIAHIRRR